MTEHIMGSNDILQNSDFPTGWAVLQNNETGWRHVVPLNDIKPHQFFKGPEDCPCNPKADNDDCMSFHNAWDQRERYQDGKKKD